MAARYAVHAILLGTLCLPAVCAGMEYHVDAVEGNDRNTGRGPQVAWRSLNKVNSYTGFLPGDRILLRRGQVWREQLIVSTSGTADKPFVIGAYGTGSRPMLKGSDSILKWTQTGQANCWRAPLAPMPNQVFFDGSRGTQQNALSNLDKPLEWAWSGGTLYVCAGGAPDAVYPSSGIEASVRPSTRSQGLLYIKDQEYVVVQDIAVMGSYGFGIYIKPWAHNVTIRNCEVGHSLDGGLVVPTVGGAGASQITVEDCLIHHNNGGFKEGAPGVATYHEGLTMENVDGFVIRRTRVYDNYMEGVNFKRGARNGVIEDCDLYSNDLINLYVEGASDIVIRYNRIYDCTYNAGIEFGLETNAYHNDRIRIHNNLFWGNSGAVSFWAAPVVAQTRNITIDNNTFYDNEFGVRWKSSATGNFGGVNFIRNNLFWPQHARWAAIRDQTAGQQALARTTVAFNAFQKSTTTDVTGERPILLAGANLADPISHDFHLRPDSICIDSGMDVGLTRDYDGNAVPQGRAPDIGAYEHVSALSHARREESMHSIELETNRIASEAAMEMDAAGGRFDPESAREFYSGMYLIRTVESSLLELFERGELTGTVHTCIGQEACAVGVVGALDAERDLVFSNHRAHGHYIAYCDDVEGLIAEIMGRSAGVCGGIGGSQHLHRRRFYTNGIQGGIVPNAAGAALAARLRGSGAISAVFLGDGTMGQGVVYESLNVASLWSLPVLFVLEDNGYAQTTPKHLAHAGSFTDRARAFRVETRAVAADDVFRVRVAAAEAVEQVRRTQRPFFLALSTYRLAPHSKGDDFRNKGEIESRRNRDPLARLGALLPDGVRRAVEERAKHRVLQAIQSARESSPADLSTLAGDSLR